MSYNVYRLEREALENAYARRLLFDYNIKEVTTQRQTKNGTREFEFPVSCFSKKMIEYNGAHRLPKDKLRIATFKSGYVRKQNGTYSPYQLNKAYKREFRRTVMDGKGKLFTHKSICIDREMVFNQMARMIYMLEYYKRNYAK